MPQTEGPSAFIPGMHWSDRLSLNDFAERIHTAVNNTSALLPLPCLRAPDLIACPSNQCSSRIRKRHKTKTQTWRIAVACAASLGWLHGTRNSRPFKTTLGGSLRLVEMEPHHCAAWVAILREAPKLADARRLCSVTGADALAAATKRTFSAEYTMHTCKNTYVPLIASIIAEPSQPHRFVSLLDALPDEWRCFYSNESTVLKHGGRDASQIDVLRKLGNVIGGDRKEYVKYFQRADISPLWAFCVATEAKGPTAFKTVMKKDGIHQRKILATLLTNYLWGPPPREEDLGLWGGSSLVGIVLERDRMLVGTADQENCFTYALTPEWMWPYFCCPPLYHWEFGGPSVTGLKDVPLHTRVCPMYKRLPMGCTHSVDLIVVMNRHAVGNILVNNRKFHLERVFSSKEVCVLQMPQPGFGMCWEFCSGTARWSSAMAEQGWGYLTPIDIKDDARLDLLNPFFLEKVFMIGKAGVVDELHSGTECTSFSRAVTPSNRSPMYPEGYPWLSSTAAAKVRIGNLLTKVMCAVITCFCNSGAGATEENPSESYHWLFPDVVQCVKDCLHFSAVIHYCCFGTPWKKATLIRSNRPWIEQLSCMCTGDHIHTPLRGYTWVDGIKHSWTSLAAPYPWKLVVAWAKLLTQHAYAQNRVPSNKIDKFWGRTDCLVGDGCVDLNRTGTGIGRIISDSTTARYSHIDDHAVIGSSSKVVNGCLDVICDRLEDTGFIIGERCDANHVERYIGYASQITLSRLLRNKKTQFTIPTNDLRMAT